MRFIHCGVHRQEYRRLVRGDDGASVNQPEPVTVGCPVCGVWYIGELAPAEEPPDLEAQIWDAEERLQGECPDHAHKFDVSGVSAS